MLAISLWLSTILLLSFKLIEILDFVLSKKEDLWFYGLWLWLRIYGFPEFLIVSNAFHIKIAAIISFWFPFRFFFKTFFFVE